MSLNTVFIGSGSFATAFATMGVSTTPGHIALTRMPRPADSRAALFVNPMKTLKRMTSTVSDAQRGAKPDRLPKGRSGARDFGGARSKQGDKRTWEKSINGAELAVPGI